MDVIEEALAVRPAIWRAGEADREIGGAALYVGRAEGVCDLDILSHGRSRDGCGGGPAKGETGELNKAVESNLGSKKGKYA